MRIGDACQIPVLVSSGATAVGSSRIAGPGRGPGPEGSEEPLAAAVNAPSISTMRTVARIALAAPLTPAKSRTAT